MKIYDVLNIDIASKQRYLISFVGGGGKTSTMFKLANELKAAGKSVLVTTTTAIFFPCKTSYDYFELTNDKKPVQIQHDLRSGSIYLLGRKISKDNKLLGLQLQDISALYEMEKFNYILVEADGSKGRPIKAPAEHEPVVPTNTTKTVGIIGLDVINKAIKDEWVHRSNIFSNLCEKPVGDLIDTKTIVKLIVHNKGLFKNSPLDAEKYLILNKADTLEKQKQGQKILDQLKIQNFTIVGGIVAAMEAKESYIKYTQQYDKTYEESKKL